jgi:hypothetical protein
LSAMPHRPPAAHESTKSCTLAPSPTSPSLLETVLKSVYFIL